MRPFWRWPPMSARAVRVAGGRLRGRTYPPRPGWPGGPPPPRRVPEQLAAVERLPQDQEEVPESGPLGGPHPFDVDLARGVVRVERSHGHHGMGIETVVVV